MELLTTVIQRIREGYDYYIEHHNLDEGPRPIYHLIYDMGWSPEGRPVAEALAILIGETVGAVEPKVMALQDRIRLLEERVARLERPHYHQMGAGYTSVAEYIG